MPKFKYILAFFLLIGAKISFGATQTISVIEPQKASTGGVSTGAIIISVIVGIIVLAVIIGVVWLIVWLYKKWKEGQDVWYKIKKDKLKLCNMHKDKSKGKHFWRFTKNCPIKLFYSNDNKMHSKTIGYYGGHFHSRDGNINVIFYFRRKFWVLPMPDLLIVNTKKEYIIPRREIVDDGRRKETVIVDEIIKLPQNIISFTDEEVLLNAYAIDMDYRTEFFFPVMKDSKGHLINLGLPAYESMKAVAVEGYLYDQTCSFVQVAKKSIELNPTIRGINKVSDSSSSIDTNQNLRGE